MKSIAITEHAHRRFKKLATLYDTTLGELLEHTAGYLEKTGIDPRTAEHESPIKSIKELEKRLTQIIAFVKTHEMEKLNPLLEHLVIISKQLDDTITKAPKAERFEYVIKKMNEILESTNNHEVEVYKMHVARQKTTEAALKSMQDAIIDLKNQQKAIAEVIENKLSKKGLF